MGKARRRKAEAKASAPIQKKQARATEPIALSTPMLGLAIVLIATIAAYAGVRLNRFVYFDDPKYVTENPVVMHGLTGHGIRWAFTTGTDANWFPLTWMSHMLDVQLFGMSPSGHHATSVLLHLLSTALLFMVLLRTTRAPGRSLFVAGLFALHPLHVESVAWVAERKDVLSTFFLMLTLGSYALYSEKRTAGHYALVAGFLALGLMSKAMLVTTPFLLLLLDFWPLERTRQIPFGQLVREKIPLLIIAIASSVVTFIVQQSGGAVRGLEAFPLPMRIGNAIVSYAEYMRLMIWPSGLAAFYPYPEFPSPGIIALSAIILAAITAAVIRYRTSHPYLLVGWLWYLGTLVPVIGLVQVGNQAMADRYTYIPLIGLFVIVAWGAHDVIAQRALPKWVMPAAATAVLLAFAVVTGRQVTYWRDSTTLWTHALSVTSGNYVAHNNLGRELTEAGRIDQAVAQYDSALAIKPQYATARTNRGVALAKQGKYNDAIAIYKGAIAIKPDLPEAHINLGAALASQGRNDEAIDEYRTAIRLNPNLADAHADLGLALGKTGKVDEALKEYATALSIRPDFVEVHNNFGFALAAQGKNAEAIPHFNAALALKPEFVLARLNLAMTLSNYGKKNEAVREFSEVLKYDPNNQLAKESIEMLSRR